MSRPFVLTADQHAAHRALEHLVPAFDPPAGPLPDAEQLVALAEGRLGAADAQRLRDAIAASPAARVELRALYPQTYARLFDTQPVQIGATVIPFRRRAAWVAGLAAAAAIAFFVLRPMGPPLNASADVAPIEAQTTRGERLLLLPGTRVQLRARLGQPGTLDRWRGATPWGALIRIDADGATLVCTHADAACRSSAQTMGHQAVISGAPGETVRYVFLIANQPADLSSIAGPAEGADERLKAAADAVNGQLTPTRPIVIDRP
jgi:hypothetical protein